MHTKPIGALQLLRKIWSENFWSSYAEIFYYTSKSNLGFWFDEPDLNRYILKIVAALTCLELSFMMGIIPPLKNCAGGGAGAAYGSIFNSEIFTVYSIQSMNVLNWSPASIHSHPPHPTAPVHQIGVTYRCWHHEEGGWEGAGRLSHLEDINKRRRKSTRSNSGPFHPSGHRTCARSFTMNVSRVRLTSIPHLKV